MLKITYKEYLKYEELHGRIKENQAICVAEESKKYTYDKNNEHDKVFRDILSIKEEALALINKALKNKEKIEEEIELYNNRFITSKFKERESDIIYKVKNKNVFFIIEHQSTIDYSMAYRIMEYSIEIMRLIIQNEKNKSKEYKYPLIIPIIIYTGEKKWDAKLSMKELIEKVDWYEEKENISLVDINDYTEDELLEEANMLSKVMLLEKSKNSIEFIKNVKEIIKTSKVKDLERIKNIIIYKSIGMTKQGEIENILKNAGEEEKIMTLAERINRNEREEKLRIRKEAMEEGMKEGVTVTIRKMLLLKLDDNIIKEVTGAEDKELEKLKKELV